MILGAQEQSQVESPDLDRMTVLARVLVLDLHRIDEIAYGPILLRLARVGSRCLDDGDRQVDGQGMLLSEAAFEVDLVEHGSFRD